MVKDRSTVIFYPATVCNLNCRYCSIDKNPALIQIDKILEESFKGDYYINFTKEIFPDPNQLTRVETWGGEPTLGWHRMHNLMHQIIENYPNFYEFFSSSNMVQPHFLTELQDMLNIFKEYPERKFTFYLQMSLDGTEKITDENRGKGVTKKLREVFKNMVSILYQIIPENVKFECFFKPTLDIDNIKGLQTKEAILDYYLFFEEFYDIFYELNQSKNAKILVTLPNTATPEQNTTEDGKIFANMCRLCKEIEKEGNHFKYFTDITPYNANSAVSINNIGCDGFTCGTCKQVIGLLPNNKISGCHAAFVDMLDDYKKNIEINSYANKVLDEKVFDNNLRSFFYFDKSELSKREEQMEYYYKENTTARVITVKTLIQTLAYAGQVDFKFTDDTLALQAADLIYRNASNCMNDNRNATGSLTTPSVSLLRLLLNGAYDYISIKG